MSAVVGRLPLMILPAAFNHRVQSLLLCNRAAAMQQLRTLSIVHLYHKVRTEPSRLEVLLLLVRLLVRCTSRHLTLETIPTAVPPMYRGEGMCLPTLLTASSSSSSQILLSCLSRSFRASFCPTRMWKRVLRWRWLGCQETPRRNIAQSGPPHPMPLTQCGMKSLLFLKRCISVEKITKSECVCVCVWRFSHNNPVLLLLMVLIYLLLLLWCRSCFQKWPL